MNTYPAICFHVKNDYKFVFPADIIYIESYGSYSCVYTINEETITISKNLKEIESVLPDDLFLRTHHSTIINLVYVVAYHHDDNIIELKDGTRVQLSRRRKPIFLDKFTKL